MPVNNTQSKQAIEIEDEQKRKNFGLSEAEFNDLLQRLQKDGDETLIENIFTTQYVPCRTFLERQYKVHYEDTHDVVMEVLLKFRIELKQGRWNYDNLSSAFKTKAWQQYIQLSRANRLVLVETFDGKEAPQPADSALIADELLEQLEQQASDPTEAEFLEAYKAAFESLCKYCKNLIDIYYIKNKDNKDAKKLTWKAMTQLMPTNQCICVNNPNLGKETSEGSLKVKAHTIQAKMNKHMEKTLHQTHLKRFFRRLFLN